MRTKQYWHARWPHDVEAWGTWQSEQLIIAGEGARFIYWLTEDRNGS